MMNTEQLLLSYEERESPLWRRLSDHMRAALDSLREQNDYPQLDAVKTAAIRGQIRQLKLLLALGDPPKAPGGDAGPED